MKANGILKKAMAHLLSTALILAGCLITLSAIKPQEAFAGSQRNFAVDDLIHVTNINNTGYTGYNDYRVLDKDGDYLLLISEYLWKGDGTDSSALVSFGTADNTWAGSNAQEWCETFKQKILGQISGLKLRGTKKDVLNGDLVFILSEDEASGYYSSGIDARKAYYNGGTDAQHWWLRTPDSSDTTKARIVSYVGSYGSRLVTDTSFANKNIAMRPAFWADLTDVCATKSSSVWDINSSATAHTLSDCNYTWADDDSTCTATGTCETCSEVISETVDSTYSDSGDTRTYTAEFKHSGFTTQTKEGSVWTLADFNIEEGVIKGFSDAGNEKLETHTSVVFPNSGVTAIAGAAFGGSTKTKANQKITEVTIPSNITNISSSGTIGAFQNCQSITTVTIEGAATIGANAFKSCSALTTLDLGQVTAIGNGAFTTTGLTALTVPTTVKSIGIGAFSGNNSKLLASLTLNEGLETISNAAFSNSSITSVSLPSTVTTLTDTAFGTQSDKKNRTVIVPAKGANYPDTVVKTGKGHVFEGYVMDVSLDVNGGEEIETKTVKADKTSTLWDFAGLPTPTKGGYVLRGWSKSAEGGELITADTVFNEGDDTIYAQWYQPKTITFDPNGGTVTPASATTDADGTIEEYPTPKYRDHTFQGWFTAAEGGDPVADDTVFEADATVYAHWTLNDVVATITFDPNGGALADGEPATVDIRENTLESMPADPSREGMWVFDDWYDAAEGGNVVTTETEFAGNAIVYAHWTDASTWDATDFTYAEYRPGNSPTAKTYYQLGDDTTTQINPLFYVVTGFSEMGNKKNNKNKNLTIPAKDASERTVQGVGNAAFKGKGITSVTFPENVMTENDTGWDATVSQRGDFVLAASAFASNNLTEVVLPKGVFVIENLVFQSNSGLTKVTLPETIVTAGQGSFSKCAINEVVFPAKTDFGLSIGMQSFAINQIQSVVLPSSTIVVDKHAFFQNTGKEEIVENYTGASNTVFNNEKKGGMVYMYINATTVPAKVTSTTRQSSNVQKLIMRSTINLDTQGGTTASPTATAENGKLSELPEATRDGYGFLGWYDAPEGGTKITIDTELEDGDTIYAHWVDGSLPWGAEDFTFNEERDTITGFSEIGAAKITANKQLTIPEKNGEITIKAIADRAFAECGIEGLTLPDSGLEQIGLASFQMNRIKTVAIPDSVTQLGGGAFASNPALESITIGAGLTEIPAGAFGCSDRTHWMENLTGSLVIPSNITAIGDNAFAGNNYNSITIPASVKSIGKFAFSTKNYLDTPTTLVLGEGLETIGSRAFRNKKIAEVTLPTTVQGLPDNAFEKVDSEDGHPVDNPLITAVKIQRRSQFTDRENFPESSYHELQFVEKTVEFDANEGTVDPDSIQTTIGLISELPVPERDGDEFEGWFTAVDGGDQITAETEIIEDCTVYAHWKLKETIAAENAMATADKAKAEADKAMQTPGANAVAAAKKAQNTAQEAVDAATAAKKAEDKNYEAAVEKYGTDSEQAKAAKKAADDAADLLTKANEALDAANKAVTKAEKDKADADADAKAQIVKTVTINVKTVTTKAIDAAVEKAGGSDKYVIKIILGKKVRKIKKGALKKCAKVTTLEVRTKKLKKNSVKASLKGSKVKTVKVKVGKTKANKKYVKKYKKIFTKKNVGRKVKVKR